MKNLPLINCIVRIRTLLPVLNGHPSWTIPEYYDVCLVDHWWANTCVMAILTHMIMHRVFFFISLYLHSLFPWRYGCWFGYVIFKHVAVIAVLSFSCEIAIRSNWIRVNIGPVNDLGPSSSKPLHETTLTETHDPYAITRPRWVKLQQFLCDFKGCLKSYTCLAFGPV